MTIRLLLQSIISALKEWRLKKLSGVLKTASLMKLQFLQGRIVQALYIFLCIAGAVLPLSQFVPRLSAHGIDVPLLLLQATSSHIAAFAWADVLISGIAVAVFIFAEGRRLAMRLGPSLALPLFLLLRERHLAGMR